MIHQTVLSSCPSIVLQSALVPQRWWLVLLNGVDPCDLFRLLRTGGDNVWTWLIPAGLSAPACMLPGEEASVSVL